MNIKLKFLPERPEKPRESGVNMVMDKGLSLREAENLIESSGHLVDLVKLGFGTSIVSNNVKEKIKLYQDNGIKCYVGGTLFEAFLIRNQIEDYYRFLEHYGLDVAEVSDGSMIIDHDEKCMHIEKLSKMVTVLSEVGSKDEGILISPDNWIAMMNKELNAGSWKVIAEARESGNVGIYRSNGSAHTVLIDKILSEVEGSKIMWEAPIKAQQVWFIKLLGANVNLGNIAPNEVIPLETLRLGLRGDTFFSFLPEELNQKSHAS